MTASSSTTCRSTQRGWSVPRWLAGWGLVGVALLAVAGLLALFTDRVVTGYWPLARPIAVQEIVLAAWLLFRGLPEPGPASGGGPGALPAGRVVDDATAPARDRRPPGGNRPRGG